MGTSKFTFPMPGRRSKPAPPPPVTTAPRTKAEKLLGTGEVVGDPTKLPPEPRRGWDVRSNSGISIAVSDTTASHSGRVETGLGIVQEDEVAGSLARRGHWEDESAILPPVMVGHDGVTDASSLRRRQSSSTITSYYDKSKLPLSISQQTSNSAMAKGLPTKASMLLDIEGVYAEPAGKTKKKKPAMLDLTGLLNRQRSSKFLKPETYKGLVLGPDLVTKSPSIMSLSPDATPPPITQRVERHIRKKMTKESLKEAPTPEPPRQSPVAVRPTQRRRGDDRRHRPTKSTVDLMNLYDHYEQRSFADVLEEQAEHSDSVGELPNYPTPPTSSHNGFLAPQQPNGVRMAMPASHATSKGSAHDVSLMGTSPSSLISPPTDSASISSRHTRTSKASKRTDRSLTDLDLQQNSVLSLSSDSEDDGYEASSKSSLAIPALSMSDGQASPTSPRSAVSQRSAATAPQEGNRGKLPKRTSFATQPQFLPIPEGVPSSTVPQINARSSSLALNAAAKKQGLLLHQTSRLSIATTSTGRTVSGGTIPGTKANRNSPPRQWPASANGYDGFPAPPAHHGHRFPTTAQSPDQPTPPLSPTSVDFYLQGHRNSKVAFDIDTRSVSSGRSLGSQSKGARRGSAASSHQESNGGRFMAVTRQEEMLLAALRQKRALMRESMVAGHDEHIDRGGEELQRQYTNGSSSGISRQSSRSTMRTVDATGFGALSARPQHPQIRVSSSNSELRREKVVHEQILLMMDRPSDESAGLETAEPSPDLDGFLGFDDGFEFPIPERRGRTASVESASGPSPKSHKTTPSPAASGFRTGPSAKESLLRRDADQSSLRSGSRRGSDKGNPVPIMEDPREEEDNGVPRPDSPISPMDFPVPMSITRKKLVRLSAVGN